MGKNYYIAVVAEGGGGCIAEPTWTLSAKSDPANDPATGLTYMRCAADSVEFSRILRTVLSAKFPS